jgi:hypothetical protein
MIKRYLALAVAGLLTATIGTLASAAGAQAPAPRPSSAISSGSARFDFHSAMWVNLHWGSRTSCSTRAWCR